MAKLKRSLKTELIDLMKACGWDHTKSLEECDRGIAEEGDAYFIFNRYVIHRYEEDGKMLYQLSAINVIQGGYMDPPEEDWEDILKGTLKEVFTRMATDLVKDDINSHFFELSCYEEEMEAQDE